MHQYILVRRYSPARLARHALVVVIFLAFAYYAASLIARLAENEQIAAAQIASLSAQIESQRLAIDSLTRTAEEQIGVRLLELKATCLEKNKRHPELCDITINAAGEKQ